MTLRLRSTCFFLRNDSLNYLNSNMNYNQGSKSLLFCGLNRTTAGLQHYKTKNKLISLYAYVLLLSRWSTIFFSFPGRPHHRPIFSIAADFTLSHCVSVFPHSSQYFLLIRKSTAKLPRSTPSSCACIVLLSIKFSNPIRLYGFYYTKKSKYDQILKPIRHICIPRHGNDHYISSLVINFPPLNFQCLLVLITRYWEFGCFRMAHEEGDPAEIARLTGVGKYFNTLTTKGRVNVSTN